LRCWRRGARPGPALQPARLAQPGEEPFWRRWQHCAGPKPGSRRAAARAKPGRNAHW
jgi:hypothetical protein